MSARRIVVAISGASGSIYARRLLAVLGGAKTGSLPGVPAMPGLDVHWVATTNAELVWQQELGEPMPSSVPGTRRWAIQDFAAPFASGSNAPDAVIVAPCSMSTLARVAHGGGGDLISRACDVALKERRGLVLLARETPLSLVHLRNMVAATEAGAIVLPAVPSFYGTITTLEEAIDTVIARALDRAGLQLPLVRRWGEQP
ncbi:MAG: UbiX family flavin prenyltransferase [Deltaproteobacteria bacterium]|nr:UbiX family flavin prenyltransferase [Nannocystaceae bacterium]